MADIFFSIFIFFTFYALFFDFFAFVALIDLIAFDLDEFLFIKCWILFWQFFWKRITHFSFLLLSQNSTPGFSLNWNKSNHIRYTTKYFKIKQICRRIFKKTRFQDYFVSIHANYENNIIYPFHSPSPTFSLSLYSKISTQNLFCFPYISIQFFEISKTNRCQNNNKIPHPNWVFSFSIRNFTFLIFIELFFTFSKCPNLFKIF